MDLVYNVDFEIFALIFTILMFIEVCIFYPNKTRQNQIFRYMVIIAITSISFDLITAFTISYGESIPNWINIIVNSGYFMSGFLLCFTFHLYIEKAIVDIRDKKPILLRINFFILCIMELAVILNAPFGYFFYFTPEHIYTPGLLYYMMHIVSTWFVICASVSLIVNHKSIEKKKMFSSVLFIMIYVISVILQTFIFPDCLLIMPAVSVMLIVAVFSLESPDYFKLQSTLHDLTDAQNKLKVLNDKYYNLAYTDIMTGISNRTAYNVRLEQLKAVPDKSGLIFMIADINRLKYLNDNFGHLVGDETIEKTATILTRNFGEGYTCYRIGGDEFAVIGSDVTPEDFTEKYESFLKDIRLEAKKTVYPFSVASGYRITGNSTIFEALKEADGKMYNNKIKMKQNNYEN